MQTTVDRRKTEIEKKLEKVFDKSQATVLTEVISDAYSDLVKSSDFNELKGIVKELGVKVGELAEAQKRTEVRVAELAEAQKGSEQRLTRLEAVVERLAIGQDDLRKEFGNFSRTMSYAFENEAYRGLSGVLKQKYGIVIKDKVIRAEVGGREINIFGRGEKESRDVFIVGEAKLKLDEKIEELKRRRKERDVFEELEEKVEAVKEEYGGADVVRVLVCHFATKGFLKMAGDRGVIVVQSFEW